MVWQLSPLVRCCLVPSLFDTSVSTFPSFHDTPTQENVTIPSPDARFHCLSKVLHSVAISLVITTSIVKKFHTSYTPGPVLAMAITNEDTYVGKQTWKWNWGAYETHHTWVHCPVSSVLTQHFLLFRYIKSWLNSFVWNRDYVKVALERNDLALVTQDS